MRTGKPQLFQEASAWPFMDATTWRRPCRSTAATPTHPSGNLTPRHNAISNPAPACGLAGAQLRQKAGSQHSLPALPQDDQRSWRQKCHVNALRPMRLKNAREAAESQQREKAAERQRRGKGVPATVVAVSTSGLDASVTTSGPMPGVNPAGLSPGGDTARPPSGVAARRTADYSPR